MMHFSEARANSFPLWGPWPKERGEPYFTTACGKNLPDLWVHRGGNPCPDCAPCEAARLAWGAEKRERQYAAMLAEAGPGWVRSPRVYEDGSESAQIACGPVVARRVGPRWHAEAPGFGSLDESGPTLMEAVQRLVGTTRRHRDFARAQAARLDAMLAAIDEHSAGVRS